MGLIRNTTYYTIGTILPKLGSFIFLPIYLKFMSPGEYGIVSSLFVLSAVFEIVFTLSLPRALYRIYYDYGDKREQKKLIGTLLSSVITIATINLVLILLLRSYVGKIYSSIDFFPYYVYLILSVFCTSLHAIPLALLQIKEKALTFISLNVTLFFLKSAFLLYNVAYLKLGAIGYLKADLISNIIFVPLYYIFIKDSVIFSWDKTMFKSLLNFSLPIIPGVFSAWILNLSDRIFIEHNFNTSDVGIYSLAYSIAGLVLVFTSAFKSAYDPYFYKIANAMPENEAKDVLFRTNYVFTIVLLTVTFVMSLFAREVISLLFNDSYQVAIKIIPIISLGYMFSQTAALLNVMVYQMKKTKVIMYITIVCAIINISINFILIPRFGIFGAAWSTVISFLSLFLLSYYKAKEFYFIPFNWKKLTPFFLIFGCIFLLFYWLDIKNVYLSILLKVAVVLLIVLYFYGKNKAVLLSILRR